MTDDWRLRIELEGEGAARALTERLEANELGDDIRSSFKDRLIVSVDGPEVFCYTGSREEAERAEEMVRSLAAEHHWQAEYELTRWHPVAEQWRAPDEPLPQTDAERAAERSSLMEQERGDSAEYGYPQYEVRVQCASHRDTIALARKLEQEGLPNTHRWRYLLVGATDEDSAKQLAGRLAQELPAGCTVTAESNLRTVLDEESRGVVAIFGGLGG